MDHEKMKQTLNKQRETLIVEPIHATLEPVRAYAEQIAKKKGEPFSVVEVAEGSTAHRMGYRFASIPNTELEYYLANGARLAA